MAEPDRDDADVIGRLLMRVYEIHERIIARGGGGLEGIRDAALLHAAVARPFATFGEVELYPTDFDKAAALFHSLIKSHPFMDGTKGHSSLTPDFSFPSHCRRRLGYARIGPRGALFALPQVEGDRVSLHLDELATKIAA